MSNKQRIADLERDVARLKRRVNELELNRPPRQDQFIRFNHKDWERWAYPHDTNPPWWPERPKEPIVITRFLDGTAAPA